MSFVRHFFVQECHDSRVGLLLMVKKLVNNRLFTISTGAGFFPSTNINSMLRSSVETVYQVIQVVTILFCEVTLLKFN